MMESSRDLHEGLQEAFLRFTQSKPDAFPVFMSFEKLLCAVAVKAFGKGTVVPVQIYLPDAASWPRLGTNQELLRRLVQKRSMCRRFDGDFTLQPAQTPAGYRGESANRQVKQSHGTTKQAPPELRFKFDERCGSTKVCGATEARSTEIL